MATTQPPPEAFAWDDLQEDRDALRVSLANHLVYTLGKDPLIATPRDWFDVSAHTVRDRLLERWMETARRLKRSRAKRVYYFSLEFLTGRLLSNGMMSVGLDGPLVEALSDLGLTLEQVADIEPDPALGNGGLGRLAACLLDSMASVSIPGFGYGIRYEYGLFFQRIQNGAQVEQPDNWLRAGNPWEFARPEILCPVQFGGHVTSTAERGRLRFRWQSSDTVMAMAFDTPVPGYQNGTVNKLRLWSARASRDFNLQDFNQGEYLRAVEQKTASENLSKVLYPADSTPRGRELRLKQQYFFVSASMQDILRRFLRDHDDFDELPDAVAIQLNDTHPAVAIPELMRLLIDVHELDWDRAWRITRGTFAYTNHTLLPEALETWPVEVFERILPRHLQIVYEINHRFLETVRQKFPGDEDRVRRMSILDEEGGRRIRMAHLATIGSHHVNGVSRIHTDLMKQTIFADFEAMAPGTIVNVTNGITPRRWLIQANPGLAALITRHIGAGWTRDLSALGQLAPLADDPGARAEFHAVKLAAKRRLAAVIHERLRVPVDPASMFDVHVKRIHEYKRQLLNVLHVVTRYNRLRGGRALTPRTVIFSGKAAPGYAMAKLIIELIHGVARVVNRDRAAAGRLTVVFMPNYSVTNAERIIPGSDLSEQISTAGMEASGTGNMKLALNGALTIGTLDGATIEMRDEVGAANMFTFGMTADEVAARRAAGYSPWDVLHHNDELREAMDMIAGGAFSGDRRDRFRPIVDALTTNGDPFFVLADYASYIACQEQVDEVYRDPEEWTRRAILNIAGMGRFSSDRTVLEYASTVWKVSPQLQAADAAEAADSAEDADTASRR